MGRSSIIQTMQKCSFGRFSTLKRQLCLIALTKFSDTCNLNFCLNQRDLSETLSNITVAEEDEVLLKKQLEEDLHVYGGRPEPMDTVEVDEQELLTKPSSKRSASDFEPEEGRIAKVQRKNEILTSHQRTMPAMDWNAGESPLSAWLNQSAIPAALPISLPDESRDDSREENRQELLEQEKSEVEVFKYVRVEAAAEVCPADEPRNETYLDPDLDLGAQIYYRNIKDRYPYLKPFLARRLATANCARAKRLWSGEGNVRETVLTSHDLALERKRGLDRIKFRERHKQHSSFLDARSQTRNADPIRLPYAEK